MAPRKLGIWLSGLALAIVVIAGLGYAVSSWWRLSEAPLSLHGWIALSLGVFFSIALGGGLSALLIISRRRGFDERVGYHAHAIASHRLNDLDSR